MFNSAVYIYIVLENRLKAVRYVVAVLFLHILGKENGHGIESKTVVGPLAHVPQRSPNGAVSSLQKLVDSTEANPIVG